MADTGAGQHPPFTLLGHVKERAKGSWNGSYGMVYKKYIKSIKSNIKSMNLNTVKYTVAPQMLHFPNREHTTWRRGIYNHTCLTCIPSVSVLNVVMKYLVNHWWQYVCLYIKSRAAGAHNKNSTHQIPHLSYHQWISNTITVVLHHHPTHTTISW